MGVKEGENVELGRPDETTRPDVSARRQAQKGKALYTLIRSARALLARRAGVNEKNGGEREGHRTKGQRRTHEQAKNHRPEEAALPPSLSKATSLLIFFLSLGEETSFSVWACLVLPVRLRLHGLEVHPVP